jgi:MtrB/PioB family decaheme-associated outer membrane protein
VIGHNLQRDKQMTRSYETTLVLSTAVLAFTASAQSQEAARPDTSEWACEQCPFDRGYRSETRLGGAYVSDSAAKFGNYTGLDEDGGYVIADAEGKYSQESGYVLEYSLEDLGLDSRAAQIEGGKQGRYDFFLTYDAIPKRVFDTTQTPYLGTGGGSLTLPESWVNANLTSGMSALPSSLRNVNVESDRETYGLGGRFFAGDGWKFSLAYHREDRDGTGISSGSFVLPAVQLLKPIDYQTDRIDASVRYSADWWHVELAYLASEFDNQLNGLRWENPYVSIPGESDFGQMALEPDNDFQQLSLSGSARLWERTIVALNVAMGRGTQDQNFLAYTLNPSLAVDAVPFANLDGDIDTTHYDLSVTSGIPGLTGLRLKAWVRYDERDNGSASAVFTTPVVGEYYVANPVQNPRYSFERTRWHGSAEYEVLDGLAIALGGDFSDLKRTQLAVRSEEETGGWGRVSWRPAGTLLDLRVTAGAERREPDSYDTTLPDGQNPLMRKYNMAYRYREYVDLYGSYSLADTPLSFGISGFYADDSYSRSVIGLRSARDARVSGDISYAFNDNSVAYVHAGYESIDGKQRGSESYADPDWEGQREDEFVTAGVGLRMQSLFEKFDLSVDYTYGESTGKIDLATTASSSGGRFPDLETELNSLRVELTYRATDRLDVLLGWWWEKFDSKDWSLQGVEPATLPQYLSLGADPYDYDVNVLALSARYYFGQRSILPPEDE